MTLEGEQISKGSRSSNAVSRGWPLDFQSIRNPPQGFAAAGIIFLFLLGLALLLLTLIAIFQLGNDLLSTNHQRASEATKSLLPLAAAAVGLPLIIWRLVILSEQTRITEAKTQIDRETHYTSIFSRSVEQLGQTREVKQLSNSSGTSELTTQTAPNIEVRLGGIHSLSRLAEESTRDRPKIESLLRSYVRENSWSDRTGGISNRKVYDRLSSWEWRNVATSEKANALSDWIDYNNSKSREQIFWANSLPETRVDVNEAIDATSSIEITPETQQHKFYECLFVGRVFNSELLNAYRFERCVFVKCTLVCPEAGQILITWSQLLDCVIEGRGTKAKLHNCTIFNTSVRKLRSSEISITSSYVYGLRMSQVQDIHIDFDFSDLFDGYLYFGGQTVTIEANMASFIQCTISEAKLSAESSFNVAKFPESKFTSVDFSLVDVDPRALEEATANHKTLHPSGRKRPRSWPSYDPNNPDDDEIPF